MLEGQGRGGNGLRRVLVGLLVSDGLLRVAEVLLLYEKKWQGDVMVLQGIVQGYARERELRGRKRWMRG